MTSRGEREGDGDKRERSDGDKREGDGDKRARSDGDKREGDGDKRERSDGDKREGDGDKRARSRAPRGPPPARGRAHMMRYARTYTHTAIVSKGDLSGAHMTTYVLTCMHVKHICTCSIYARTYMHVHHRFTYIYARAAYMYVQMCTYIHICTYIYARDDTCARTSDTPGRLTRADSDMTRICESGDKRARCRIQGARC
jgi:hypothetical protein